MSSFEDSCGYESYHLDLYEDLNGAPLIMKKSRIIAAVVQNQVEVLKDLLDSPKWYNVTDNQGYSLLQIAIILDHQEIFDYLMSVDFPLEHVNKKEQTALVVALDVLVGEIYMPEYYALELVKKGASIDKTCSQEDTPLHRSLIREYTQVAQLLIETGVDVNVVNNEGYTPLELVLTHCSASDLVMTLLMHGAEPSVRAFEISVLKNRSFLVQETLFLYVFDEFSNLEIYLEVLLKLAKTKSQLLHQILKLSTNNLKVVFESDLKLSSINPIDFLDYNGIWNDLVGLDYGTIAELFLFLLSYGLNLNEWDLQLVYKHFGYCELFKIFLHMDFKLSFGIRNPKNIMAVFIYHLHMDLGRLFSQDSCVYYRKSANQLLHYFVHPKLREIHYKLADQGEVPRKENLEQIPLLVELSRNEFRKFFIEKFQLKTTRQFYSLLDTIPISTVHKKIISYETGLY